MTLLAIGPLARRCSSSSLWFPETAHLELEQINPEDRRPADAPAAAVLAGSPEGAEEAGHG